MEKHSSLRETALEVQKVFAEGDENKAYLVLDRLAQECAAEGAVFERTAEKGRLPFIFIRPSRSQEGPVQLSGAVLKDVEDAVVKLICDLEYKAELTKELMRRGSSLEEAIDVVNNSPVREPKEKRGILYFQPDVIFRSDGSFVIDKINIPDVVFFLTEVNPSNNSIFSDVQQIVTDLKSPVMEAVVKKIKEMGKSDVAIVTRDGVIDNDEDTLERHEITKLFESLGERGISSTVFRISDVGQIPPESFVMLLNVSAQEQGFSELLLKQSRDEISCYPDPFLFLFKDSAHTYPKAVLDRSHIANLRAILEPLELDEKHPELVYRQMTALQYYLGSLGFEDEDFFYFTSGDGVLAPAFRYDLRGFTLALNEFSDCEELEMRGLYYKPEDALIQGKDGPRLAAFRFMFIGK